jgi:hypothetical protein
MTRSMLNGARSCLIAATVLLLAFCGCGGEHKAGVGTPAKQSCSRTPDTTELKPEPFQKMFKSHQAAYYVAEGENILLAIRVKEDLDTAEVMGKFLALVTTKFDFVCEKHVQIILVCYKGFIEEKRNIGMLLDIGDLRLLQRGDIGIEELSDRARYIEGLDLGSVKSLIYK